MSYRTMADDMAALIDVMGLEKVLVCGYSDGEQIALELGMRCPELCRALLAGAVWCTFTKQYLHAIKAFGVEGSGSVDFARLESDNAGLVEWWRGEHAPLGESDGWKAMLGQISRLWWTPLDYTSDDLARITVPTLILQGDRDGLIPIEQGVGLFGRLPNAELAVLPGRNHLSALAVASGEERSTGYEPFVPVVLDFLMRNGGRRVPGTVAQGVDRT
jgi:pimeloyl-ACP methyl ester carboxylesterase